MRHIYQNFVYLLSQSRVINSGPELIKMDISALTIFELETIIYMHGSPVSSEIIDTMLSSPQTQVFYFNFYSFLSSETS